MVLEILLGIVMVIVLLGTVAAKYVTATKVVRMRDTITKSDAELRNLRGKLKTTEAEAGISKRKAKTLEKQVKRIETRIKNHKDELQTIAKK